jgi:ABC-type multidrug transport system ATPase subunit
MIRFRGVTFGYDGSRPVLAGADLDLPAGLTILAGPNGCGKSTLLKLAAGIERPDLGTVEIRGHDLWTREREARSELAYVPEQPDLTPYATLEEILLLVGRLRGEPEDEARRALAWAGLEAHARRTVRDLSLGQRRRALLAAATVGRARVLLLDEPLEGLDGEARDAALDWIGGRAASGDCLLVSAHDVRPFAARAVRAVTIREGRPHVVDPLPAAEPERIALLEALARGQGT